MQNSYLGSIFTIACLSAGIFAPLALAQTSIGDDFQLQIRGQLQELPDWEREYLVRAVDRLYDGCQVEESSAALDVMPADRKNQLRLELGEDKQRVIQAVGGSSNPFSKLAFYEEDSVAIHRLGNCNAADVLPVASILQSRNIELLPLEHRTVAGLTSYEPNRIGWTFDDNDVDDGYLDAVLSLKYPFFHDGYYSADAPPLNPYFAFTGRFSQYLESRDSSPVVGKRFNPKFFLRHWLGDDSRHVDFGLAHESNGQNINSEAAYLREREDFADEGQDPDFARDYISRGWDYLSLDWKHNWGRYSGELDTYLALKYFLDDGPFQGNPEEYNDWEGDGINRRREYDGVSLQGNYLFDRSFCLTSLVAVVYNPKEPNFCFRKLAWEYTTGYDNMFDHSTNRLEFTIDLGSIPIMLWGQHGYNSDLVDYYQDVDSWGLSLELQSALWR